MHMYARVLMYTTFMIMILKRWQKINLQCYKKFTINI